MHQFELERVELGGGGFGVGGVGWGVGVGGRGWAVGRRYVMG